MSKSVKLYFEEIPPEQSISTSDCIETVELEQGIELVLMMSDVITIYRWRATTNMH